MWRPRHFRKASSAGAAMEGIARASGKSWSKTGARSKSTAEALDAVKALKKKEHAASARHVKLPHVGKGDVPAGFVTPQLATLVSAPPRGEGWVHEIKFDGYRLLTVMADRHADLFTRAANDWSERFKPLCAVFAKLKVSSAVIDGEVIHLADDGTFSFHGLQNALSTEKLDHLRYYAFDLLHLNGVDLRARPLTERKALLQELMAGAPDKLLYSEHFAEPGDEVLSHACDLALEGIVSKRAEAPYRSGRTDLWLKSKCIKEQELVIGGYTEQPNHPGVLGALIVGYFEGDALRFAGKVGTGFTQAEARVLLKKLQERAVKASPFASLPTDARRGAHFVKPDLVAHVNFSEWTPEGKLRAILLFRDCARISPRARWSAKRRSRCQPSPSKDVRRRRARRKRGRTTRASPMSSSRIPIACCGRMPASPSLNWRDTMRQLPPGYWHRPAIGR